MACVVNPHVNSQIGRKWDPYPDSEKTTPEIIKIETPHPGTWYPPCCLFWYLFKLPLPLRKGPYAPPTNYEPPDVRQMRLYLEAKERERKTREELESRLETVEFDSWIAKLSTEDRIRFVPTTDFAKPGSPGHNVQLKQYFRERVWPERRDKVLRGEI